MTDPPLRKNKREFFTSEILEDALRKQQTLRKVMNDRRERGEKCFLAEQLQKSVQKAQVVHLEMKLRNFLKVKPIEMELVNEVASGSEGSVWKISWRQGTFARKVFFHQEAFEREAGIAQRICHPHIVHTFGLSNDGDKSSLLMELLNEDLCSHVTVKTASRGDAPPFTLLESLDVLLQVAEALKYLHDINVVHGDLKSSNVLVSEFEIAEDIVHYLIKVADFGSAQVVESNPVCPFQPKDGTTRYAAPEVLKCRRDRRKGLECPYKLDVYSYGIIAYEVLTGVQPYDGMETRRIASGVMDGTPKPNLDEECSRNNFKYPAHLTTFIKRCWDSNPRNRPSFSAVCRELNEAKKSASKLQWNVAGADASQQAVAMGQKGLWPGLPIWNSTAIS